MEFGQGGRIQQLWVAEAASPEATQEFQFVCPNLEMGEEMTEAYFPGTVLLGARMDPEDPWIVSRNHDARRISSADMPSGTMGFEYEFSFLEELGATGRFYEIEGPIPVIAWDFRIVNRSRRSVEIGELGFPLALNNVYEGFPRTDRGTRELFHDRVYVHKFIGAGASYIYAERMTGRPPGLVIYPGEDTKWEFYNHVPASLGTPFRWEGIPVVYVLSRAAIEREGWPEWFNGHSSVVLEPGDSRDYYMRFAPSDRFQQDPLAATLVTLGRPYIGLAPCAVAPIDVPITVEVDGCTPARFATDVDAEVETESDEEGGSCVVHARAAGPIKVSFEDTAGRESDASLLFTLPFETLIERRAAWIVKHQTVTDEGPLRGAIVAANSSDGTPVLDLETFATPFGLESGLSDALFLAEKNTLFPNKDEIATLNSYVDEFLEAKIVNPGDLSIGSLLPNPHGVAVATGRGSMYSVVFCLYDALMRIANGYGETSKGPEEYRQRRNGVWRSMTSHCAMDELSGVPMMSYLYQAARSDPDLAGLKEQRQREVTSRKYPFGGDSTWSAQGFEEAFWTAREHADTVGIERYLRYMFAGRSLSPCWWWYGSDKRWVETPHAPPHPAMADKGEMCLGPTTVANSLLYLSSLDRDNDKIEPARLRMAFGGLFAVWALVRNDGAASMAFCPDAASKQFGMSWTTGDVGLGLFHYLRSAASYVLSSPASGLETYGCHFEALEEGADEHFVLRPWDGIGKQVIVRHLGLDIESPEGRIREVSFDARKRSARLSIRNPSDKRMAASLRIRGLWGERFEVDGVEVRSEAGTLTATLGLAPHATHKVQIKVLS